MTKKILLSLVFAFSLALNGCTSGDSVSEDSDMEMTAAEGGEESFAEDGTITEESTAKAETPDSSAEGELNFDKELSEGDLSADLGEDHSAPAEGLPDDTLGSVADTPPPPPSDSTELPPDMGGSSSSASNAPPEPPATESQEQPPAFDSAPPVADMPPDSGTNSLMASPAPKASLKKVKDAPFTAKDGTLLNAVYIARKGDTMKSVSETIYGSDRAKDLKKWNPYLSKKLSVGDKVYYNSPQRPTDSSKMALYFEDQGIAPQIHTTSDGEDLKKVAKELLGHKDSWKELWVTNPNLDSKGALTAGIEIRYWPQEATHMTPQASNAPMQPEAGADQMLPPPHEDAAQLPPPPVADNNFPPPPAPGANNPPDMGAQGSLEPPSLPPPPPPPAAEPPKPHHEVAAAQGTDPDLLMALGVGAGVAVLLIILVVYRKSRAKRMDFGHTQV